MDKKAINDWIMYHEIQRLLREGYSISQIALELVADPRTVKKYADMTELEYEAFLIQKTTRVRKLAAYESFVKERITSSPAASAAQVLDWLKEHHSSFPDVAAKTVYNFVMAIRQKYNIPLANNSYRDYFIVEELPYGFQSQTDFGQYYLRTTDQSRKKVHFMVMMLSRSRMKYVHFKEEPFVTKTSIAAHEAAFKYFGGITEEMVYDQDRLYIVDENLGEYLLTSEFSKYAAAQKLGLHFCRKSDPESKGKIERVVQFVKRNFLYGRLYHDIDTLQAQALLWLDRTGNGMPHSTTHKIPLEEWEIEKKYLRPWSPVSIGPCCISRAVRKDNTISYEGNFYTVPQGTYNKTPDVLILIQEGKLLIHDTQNQFICSHEIASGSGKSIINNDHKRDKRLKINQLMIETAALFEDKALALSYFEMLRKDKSRYIRDHIQAIGESLSGVDKQVAGQVLKTCMEQKYLSANMFKELLALKHRESKEPKEAMGKIILLNPAGNLKAATQPDKRDLNDYEEIFNE